MDATVDFEPALEQVVEAARGAQRGTLGGAQPLSQDQFAPIGQNPQRYHHIVLGDLDPIDHQHQEIA